MMVERAATQTMPIWRKAVILILVVVFTFAGLIGLVLPIIPGILFLGLAALLLARISKRFASKLHRSGHWRRWKRWRLYGAHLSAPDKCRLALLLACRKLVCALQRVLERPARG